MHCSAILIAKVAGNLHVLGTRFKTDPHGELAKMRVDGPLQWSSSLDAWITLTHDAAVHVMNSPAFGTDIYGRFRPSPIPLPSSFELGDDAAGLRAVIAKITRPRSQSLAAVHQACEEVAETVATRDSFDFVGDIAEPLAALVVERWFGVTRQQRREMVAALRLASDGADAHTRAAAGQVAVETLRAWIKRSRDANTFLGSMSRAWQDAAVAEDDLVAFLGPIVFSLAQRHGTRLLSHSLLGLFSLRLTAATIPYTDARQVAIEAARWEPVNQVVPRRVAADVELFGKVLRQHETVLVLLAAACRDPHHHPDPDVFNINRTEVSLAFGRGVHGCLGREIALAVTAASLDHLMGDRGWRFEPAASPEFKVEFGRACTAMPVRAIRPTDEGR